MNYHTCISVCCSIKIYLGLNILVIFPKIYPKSVLRMVKNKVPKEILNTLYCVQKHDSTPPNYYCITVCMVWGYAPDGPALIMILNVALISCLLNVSMNIVKIVVILGIVYAWLCLNLAPRKDTLYDMHPLKIFNNEMRPVCR